MRSNKTLANRAIAKLAAVHLTLDTLMKDGMVNHVPGYAKKEAQACFKKVNEQIVEAKAMVQGTSDTLSFAIDDVNVAFNEGTEANTLMVGLLDAARGHVQ